MKRWDADCLILGGGLAALVAAREIVKSGKRTVLLSDGSGASPYVHGINLPLHPLDSAERFFCDTYEGGYRQGKRALVRTLCENSLSVRGVLEGLGLALNRGAAGGIELLQPLGASVPRVASVGNALGAHAMAALSREIGDRAAFLRGRAVKLFRENGAFAALCYKDGEPFAVAAGCVVLATGGYSRLWSFTTNGADAGGEGIAMAHDVGATLTDMEFVQFEPSVAVAPPPLRGKSVITTMFYEGATLKNADGERFMLRLSEAGERVNKDVLSRAIAAEIAAGRGTPAGGVWYDCSALGRELLERSYSAYFRRYLACGIDISRTPMEIAPGAHTSLGGVEIDAHCRTSVPGLFACGEVAGGVHGANRLGGNAGLETFVFGKIAGESARRYLSRSAKGDFGAPLARLDEFLQARGGAREDLSPLRRRLGETMTRELGAIRTAESCRRAEREIGEITSMLPPSADGETLRLAADLKVARIVARCCGMRRGSVGCHFRADSAEEKEKYFIRVRGDALRRISHEKDRR